MNGGRHQVFLAASARDELSVLPRRLALAILRRLSDLEQSPYGPDTTVVGRIPAFNAPKDRLLVMNNGSVQVLYTVDDHRQRLRVSHINQR